MAENRKRFGRRKNIDKEEVELLGLHQLEAEREELGRLFKIIKYVFREENIR